MSGAAPALSAQPPAVSAFGLLLRALPVALAVFLLVVITATVVTFILPESFASSARLLVNPASNNARFAALAWTPYFAQTQVELVGSEKVLGEVGDQLGLAHKWAKQFGVPDKLKSSEVVMLLKSRIAVQVVRNSSLLDIKVFSERPEEASVIANKIAEVFCAYCASQSPAVQAEIVERAVPGGRPIRPNKPLNIALGMGVGVFLGLCAGSLVYMLNWRAQQARTQAFVPPPVMV